MEDNKLATPVTPATTETVTATAVEPAAKPTGDAQAPYKTFATEDEFNRILQSERSKAKGEILKQLNIENVENGKKELTKAEQLESDLKVTLTRLEQLEQENAIVKVGIADEFKEEALTLAKAKVNSTKNLEAALREVSSRLPNLLAAGGAKVEKVGADKGAATQPASDTQKIIETLNKKYRTNIKL
jgi:hypothetical protein